MTAHTSSEISPQARAMAERDLSDAIVQFARLHHWLVYRTWNSQHSPAGFPDLVLVRGPRVLFAELKREGGKQTAVQIDWWQALEQASADGRVERYLWRPSDWLDGTIDAVLT